MKVHNWLMPALRATDPVAHREPKADVSWASANLPCTLRGPSILVLRDPVQYNPYYYSSIPYSLLLKTDQNAIQ